MQAPIRKKPELFLPSFTKLDQHVVDSIGLTSWGTTINLPVLVRLQKAMVRYHQLTQENDLTTLFPAAAVAGR